MEDNQNSWVMDTAKAFYSHLVRREEREKWDGFINANKGFIDEYFMHDMDERTKDWRLHKK